MHHANPAERTDIGMHANVNHRHRTIFRHPHTRMIRRPKLQIGIDAKWCDINSGNRRNSRHPHSNCQRYRPFHL